jgi:hypothetical protein
VRNEIETKRNETERNETKSNKTKRNRTKRNETDRNETKRNVTSFRFVSFRFDRFRFVSFDFVSFGFVSFLFRFALYRYPLSLRRVCIVWFVMENRRTFLFGEGGLCSFQQRKNYVIFPYSGSLGCGLYIWFVSYDQGSYLAERN